MFVGLPRVSTVRLSWRYICPKVLTACVASSRRTAPDRAGLKRCAAVQRVCALSVLLGMTLTASAQSESITGVWTQQFAANSPGPRYEALMANDASGNVVLFGGAGRKGVLHDTWIWDGKIWKQQFPVHSPPARSNASMANDAAGHVVLFGGFVSSGELQDTWTWDGRDWTQQFPANSPGARESALMANDGTGNVLLFGGFNGTNAFHDTWTWSATAKTWTQQPAPVSPSGRHLASIAGDASHRVVLFGGTNENDRTLNETWTWDGTTKTWTQQSPANSPGARESASMAYDGAGRVVLFGGYPGFGAADLNDTWSWDGMNWTEERSANNPSARLVAPLAHQTAGKVVLFGGRGESVLNDTWVYQHGPANPKSLK